MKVSVIIPMYRIGGLDVVCDSLAEQTLDSQEFELIFADAIEARRGPLVRERLDGYRYQATHLGPSGGPALSDYSRSINDAIVRARGELVVIQSDYTWMAPDCLEAHWKAYERAPRSCHMLDNHCTALPPLKEGFKSYGPDWESKPFVTPEERIYLESQMTAAADDYERDLASGALDHLMWSIFATPLTWQAVQALPITRSHLKQDVQIDPNWCSLKNEGIPMAGFVNINGLDEDMDGSHLYQDQEFAWRMHAAGYRWTTAPGGLAYMVNPRSVIYCKRVNRPMRGDGADSNEARMQRNRARGIHQNPHRSLAKEQAAWRAL